MKKIMILILMSVLVNTCFSVADSNLVFYSPFDDEANSFRVINIKGVDGNSVRYTSLMHVAGKVGTGALAFIKHDLLVSISSPPVTPDCTGNYDLAGVFNGHNYYAKTDNNFFISWDTDQIEEEGGYVISPDLGTVQDGGWISYSGNLLSVFLQYDPYTGIVDVGGGVGSDYVEITNSFQNKDSAWSGWVKPDDGQPSSVQYIFDANAVNNRVYLKLNINGSITFGINSNGSLATITSTVIFSNNSNDWHFIAATAKQNDSTHHVELRIYDDGVLVTSTNNQSCILSEYTPSSNMIIGSDYSKAAYNFVGKFDDVSIFNKTLNSQEVKLLYLDGLLDGNYLKPENVRAETIYEVNDVNLIGTLNLPDANKVSYGTKFDNDTKTGTYKGKRRLRIF